MNLRRDHTGATAFGLDDNLIFLAQHGAMRSYAKTAEFFSRVGREPALSEGLRACPEITHTFVLRIGLERLGAMV